MINSILRKRGQTTFKQAFWSAGSAGSAGSSRPRPLTQDKFDLSLQSSAAQYKAAIGGGADVGYPESVVCPGFTIPNLACYKNSDSL